MSQKSAISKEKVAELQQRVIEITSKLAEIEKELAPERDRITRAAHSSNDADLANIAITTLYEAMGKSSPNTARGMGHFNELDAEKTKLENELTQIKDTLMNQS
jgi:predicted  nucleic acid-binding Zn-ribbon protein